MRFSIIIPSYQQKDFLPDAIESALAQTYKDTEIIVIDDGSTDGSLAIAQKYPVKVIKQSNRGLASARNTGIMNATGEYILPLDADDILYENCVEIMAKAQAATQADIIAPSFKEFGVNNSTVILNKIPTIAELLQANRLGYFSAVRKSCLLEVGGYSTRMLWGYEDWALWVDLFKRNKKLCLLTVPLVLYRTKETSMLTTAQQHHQELMEQIYKDNRELFV